MDYYRLTAHELHDLYREGEAVVSDVAASFLERIDQVEPKVKAFIQVFRDSVMEEAERLDSILKKSDPADLPPQFGIPVGVKDNLNLRNFETTCASRILKGYISPYDATVISKLKKAGALLMGKLNMDEFAMGSSNENSAWHVTLNPWDLTRVPGGSSGGSAASVAAQEVAWSLGSDTGGSIRLPASFCGVVGMKPTYGRVSRYGLVAFASSLDQIGTLTRDVIDCAAAMNVICGPDPRDSTSAPYPEFDFSRDLEAGAEGLKIGIISELMGEGIEPEIRDSVKNAATVLNDSGARCEEVSLPTLKYSVPIYYILATAEASSNLARYDGVRYGARIGGDDVWEMFMQTRNRGFGAEVKRRIMLGTYVLSSGYYDAYYLKAQKARTKLREDFERNFKEFDCLISPVAPTEAFRIGEKTADPLKMYLTDICTLGASLAGLPALSIPCGFKDGLPLGLQIIGKAFDENTILRVARAFEKNTAHLRREPPDITA